MLSNPKRSIKKCRLPRSRQDIISCFLVVGCVFITLLIFFGAFVPEPSSHSNLSQSHDASQDEINTLLVNRTQLMQPVFSTLNSNKSQSSKSTPTNETVRSIKEGLIFYDFENNTNAYKSKISHQLIPYDAITIDNIVWDFGAAGCSGWGVETVNLIEPLYTWHHVTKIKLITDPDWCQYPNETITLMNYLQSRQDWSEWVANARRSQQSTQSPSKSNPLIQFFISHKPPGRFPQFPYRGLINIQQRP
ncbi:hypothetical protein RFI_23548, partial [Reticulomyxa filosa]